MFKKLGTKLKEQKGFTLIELLAVIVILGIIAAIAIPAIGNVINKSNDKSKVQDALLIISAAKLYVADNPDQTLPMEIVVTKTTTDAGTGPLNSFLERTNDADGNFKVHVKEGSTSGVYEYSIEGHDANGLTGLGTTATEDALLGWGN